MQGFNDRIEGLKKNSPCQASDTVNHIAAEGNADSLQD